MRTMFKVLGCSGSESLGVHPCSFMLGSDTLFDAGSAASLLNIDQQKALRRIYLTHCHLDHIKDLAFLGENIFSIHQEPIEVYGPAPVLHAIKQHFFNNVIWPDFTKLPSATQPIFNFTPLLEGVAQKWGGASDVTLEAFAVNHPGPTYGYFIHGAKRSLVYSGDTGVTDKIWQLLQANPRVTDLLVETSFPNRLQALADDSQHLTPQGLQKELQKMQRSDVKVHVYHIKVPYLKEITEELQALRDDRIRVLQAGDQFELD